ncbi:MAG: glycosyltransferase family 4 protein, partial [Myxococcaceae bacterium]
EDVRPYDAVICTSVAARQGIEALLQHVSDRLPQPIPYKGRLELIPLGVDTERFRPRPKVACRRALKLPDKGLMLLWVGRLSVADKADLLPTLSIFERLLKLHPSLQLVIAGTPLQQEQAVLNDYAGALGIAKRVKVIPGVDPAQRHVLHAAADIFLSPVDNIQETIGLTPLEAMACGVPQVVSDWDGYRDTVTTETGFLIPTWMAREVDPVREALAPLRDWQGRDDHLALAQSTAVDPYAMFHALDALIRSEPLRKRLGAASRRRALNLFGWDVVMKQHAALWRELGARAVRTPLGKARRSYRHPPYLKAFGHYATGFVERVRISDAGREVLAGKRALPAYYLPDAEAVEAALVALEKAGKQGMPAGKYELWLLKYGLAQRN